MEGSGVFRAGSTAFLASKSCLAKNNVKTRLPPGCLTKNGGCMLGPGLRGSPTQRASRASASPKQLPPEDPEGGLRGGHYCINGSQSVVPGSAAKCHLLEMHTLRPHTRLGAPGSVWGWIPAICVLTSPPSDGLTTTA